MSQLACSPRVASLGHMGAVYLYHQLWGYILQMSPDIHELWQAFAGGADRDEVAAAFADRLTGQPPEELIDVLLQFRCLEAPGADDRSDALEAVPVKGRWNAWRSDGDAITLWTAWGARPVRCHPLSAAETAIWNAIDGERTALSLGRDHGADAVLALLERLASLEIQAVKLSAVPLSAYGGRHRWPPYLTSTMPYPPLEGEPPPAPELGAYHRERIENPQAQFDDVETTLAHLLRRDHPALDGRSYGRALADALFARGLETGRRLRVLEIGGGLGDVGAALTAALGDPDYTVLELSPALAARQRERGLEVTEGDCLEVELPEAAFDLIVANEMIGDLPAAPLAEAEPWIERFALDVEGASPETPINTGAFALLERLARWLAPGGRAVLTEFGERGRLPRVSTHLDHPEVSIHFGHLEAVAAGLGLETDFEFVIDLIEMRRDLEGMASTRSYFRAMRAMLAEAGIELEKIGYTREMIEALLGEERERVGELHFDRIEDRLMGLVPHEFKALLLRRPELSAIP